MSIWYFHICNIEVNYKINKKLKLKIIEKQISINLQKMLINITDYVLNPIMGNEDLG